MDGASSVLCRNCTASSWACQPHRLFDPLEQEGSNEHPLAVADQGGEGLQGHQADCNLAANLEESTRTPLSQCSSGQTSQGWEWRNASAGAGLKDRIAVRALPGSHKPQHCLSILLRTQHSQSGRLAEWRRSKYESKLLYIIGKQNNKPDLMVCRVLEVSISRRDVLRHGQTTLGLALCCSCNAN